MPGDVVRSSAFRTPPHDAPMTDRQFIDDLVAELRARRRLVADSPIVEAVARGRATRVIADGEIPRAYAPIGRPGAIAR